jgi:hypothetical protein
MRSLLIGVGVLATLLTACGSEEEAKQRFGSADDNEIAARPNGPGQESSEPAASGESQDPSAPAAPSGAASGTGGGPGKSCSAVNACATARDLGAVSGDSREDRFTAEGSGSTWLKVRVKEDAGGMFGYAMKLSLTLVSPSGANYDLYAYGNPLADTVECSKLMGSSVQPERSDAISLSWGEGYAANGALEDRTILIEVRHAGGACEANQKWTLLVQGNK